MNSSEHIALETPLYEALGPKSIFLSRLKKLGITTVQDLLWHFPVRYEDFSKIYKIAELEPGQEATVCGEIEDINTKRTWKKGMSVTEAMIADETGSIRAIWFNQPYIANSLHAGRTANFSGKVSMSRENELYFSNPAHEITRAGAEPKHTARLVPVYPETKGLTSRGLRFVMNSIMKRAPLFSEWIPEAVHKEQRLPEINTAVNNIHFPKKIDDALAAQKRFSFESLFMFQLFNFQQKLKLIARAARAIPIDIERIKTILAGLSFTLTQSQKQSLWEIVQDMNRTRPMNRLLQGDVGSGKTIVAAIAAISAAEHGFQTAFMAPTEILARQHFETMKKLCAKITPDDQPTIGLATGTETIIFFGNDIETKVPKKDFAKRTVHGDIAIVFGTHALIQKSMVFKNLGLVIIDEQHRFGVRQRQTLAHGTDASALIPHLLSMSATPIPRTLMLTVFGDLDLSLITELPAGRKPITTTIVPPAERKTTYDFIKKEIKNGRQAFVICPRIEPSTDEDGAPTSAGKTGASLPFGTRGFVTNEIKSVKEEYEKLSKKIFPDLRVAMIHGQMPAKEKGEIMKEFRENKIGILVATSVIEVGVDIPNASIMMIEGADRFGLAQLYQFRGRVGRGEHQSYCFLMTDSSGETAKARLKAIERAKNGFELAEEDMKLRGPGEFLGEAQSGFSDTMIQALRNPEIVKESREAAADILQKDPHLAHSPILKEKLIDFEKTIHRE
jgi:ATP-dependent DNA helicase RecG